MFISKDCNLKNILNEAILIYGNNKHSTTNVTLFNANNREKMLDTISLQAKINQYLKMALLRKKPIKVISFEKDIHRIGMVNFSNIFNF